MSEFEYLNGGNSEAQDKLATSYLLAQASVGLARTGVLSGLAVAQTTTASGSVLIAPGAGVVQASVLAGASLLVNDTTKTLDIFTANPVGGLPRNDIIVFDATTATLTVIVGTPNATPDDPTVPATACALARLRHAASATTIPTAKIDDLRATTRLAGARDPAVSTKRTSLSGPFTTVEGIVSAPSVIGDGAKMFKITASFYALVGTVAGDTIEVYLKDSSLGTTLTERRVTIPTNTYADGQTIVVTDVPAAGAHVYVLSAARVIGTGVASMMGSSSTKPIEIIVEQIA